MSGVIEYPAVVILLDHLLESKSLRSAHGIEVTSLRGSHGKVVEQKVQSI